MKYFYNLSTFPLIASHLILQFHPDMTYNVFGRMLNLAQLQLHVCVSVHVFHYSLLILCLRADLFFCDGCKSSFCWPSVPAILFLLTLDCVCAWQINHSFIHSSKHYWCVYIVCD